jgi:hypothetical protein
MTAKTATKTAPMKLLVGVKAIEAALVSISRKGQSLQKDIHVAACSVLAHVGEHREISLVTKLLASCPDMTRRNALRSWFESFGMVAFDGNDAKFDGTRKHRLGDAQAKPFWSFKPEAEYVPLDVAAAIGSLVKKLEKDEKETKVSHSAMIAQLQKLVPANAIAA